MPSESFPISNNKLNDNKQERIRDQVISPHVEAVLEIFKKRFKKELPVYIETIKDIFYTFFEQAVENTQIYSSEKNGASFPYTVINTVELSKIVYSHYKTAPSVKVLDEVEEKPKHKMEFVLGSFLDTNNGNQFTFFEEAMHQFVKQLPKALEDIEQGRESDNDDVYVLGSPTNELGTVSAEFSDRIKNGNAFKEFGTLYAEFVDSQLPKDETQRKNTNLYLYGISMGGSFATQTAEQLLAGGKVTQSHESSQQSFMQVRADTLPGASTSPIKRWQAPLGFIADSVFTIATNAYTKAAILKQKEGAGAVNKLLAKRGITPNMIPEQKKMKNEIIYGGSNIVSGTIKGEYGVLNDLFKGIPIDKSLKITEVRGKYDALQYSSKFNADVETQKAEHSGSLGENLVSTSGNRRTFAINQAHTFVFFRENELKRIEKAAESLEKLS
ncbi:MAG: hypothetical protein WCG28_04530 [bacterium]